MTHFKPDTIVQGWIALATVAVGLCCTTQAADTRFDYDRSGNLTLRTNLIAALPVIVGQPQNAVVSVGEAASFSVLAASAQGLGYQWQFNGTNLSGAVGDSLLITNVSSGDAGSYTVILANSSGSITSSPALLLLDTDGDGLPDGWEQSFFGGLGQKPYGDFDNDGVSNLDEYREDTNPTNSASLYYRLHLTSDGGSVAASPSSFKYTSNTVVTLTATAFPPEIFHGWTGAIISRTNPLTLVMNSHKTLFASFQPKSLVWVGGASGDWHNPLSWSPTYVPTAVDEVTISGSATISMNEPAASRSLALSGTLVFSGSGSLTVSNLTATSGTATFNVDVSVQHLYLSSTLSGSGVVTISNTMDWPVGTMSGAGRTVITSNATLSINYSLDHIVARTLENAGTTIWTGTGNLSVYGSVITNCPGALFEVQNAQNINWGSPTPRFDNAGTFRKSVSSGTVAVGIPFNNYGTVDIQSGTLRQANAFTNYGTVTLAAGVTHRMEAGGSASGSFNAPATSVVEWTGGSTFTLNPGAQLNGDASYRINGGTVNGNTDLTIQNLYLSSTLSGSGVVTISNTMDWPAGTMSGSGRTVIASNATLSINYSLDHIVARTLENGGTTLWTGTGNMNVHGSVITNRPGALFHVQNAQNINWGSPTPRFDNAGTFRKSVSSGTTTVGIPFNNYGTVDIQTGTLRQANIFTNNGTVTLAAGVTHRMEAGGSASGMFNAPATSVVEWPGGTFTLSPGAQLNGAANYLINGGTVNGNTDLMVQHLYLSSTLSGSGVVTISNTMDWPAGTMSGAGRTVIASNATLSINYSLDHTVARTLENAGTTLWTGTGNVIVYGSVITNCPGALFHVQNAQNINWGSPTPRFDNAGTFRKSVSSGTTTIGIPFNNYGTVDIQTGTLVQNSSFLNNGTVTLAAGTTYRMAAGGSASGLFNAPATSAVEWTGGTFTLSPGAQLNGVAQYRINGATVNGNTDLTIQNLYLSSTLSGSGLVTISNTMDWAAGWMSGVGRTLITSNATLTMSYILDLSLARTLENAGTTIWTGTGNMIVYGSVITNRPGALFHVQNAQTFAFGSNPPRFDNAGTFRKSVNSGTTTFSSVVFNNYGEMDVQTGTLRHTGGVTNNGSVTLAAGVTHRMEAGGSASGTFNAPATSAVEWPGGTFTLNPGAQLNGVAQYRFSGATVNGNTDLTIQNLYLSSTLSGSGVVTISNTMDWAAGSMSGAGRTLIASTASLTINNGGGITLFRTLENAGTTLWTGTGNLIIHGSVITNRPGALFHVQNAQSFIFDIFPSRFDNAGTFRKSVNSGATSFSNVALNNYGTVDIRSGILAVNGGFTSASSAVLNCVLGGTIAGTGYGQLQNSATINLAGALSVELLPGFVPSANDTFTVVSAGTRSGTFSSFTYPANRVTLQLSNAPSAVILTTTEVFPVPQPVLFTPELVNSNALLTWTATSNVTYRLERTPGTSPMNWLAVPGDVTTTSNTASKLDPLTPSNQLYRVRVLP